MTGETYFVLADVFMTLKYTAALFYSGRRRTVSLEWRLRSASGSGLALCLYDAFLYSQAMCMASTEMFCVSRRRGVRGVAAGISA